jgi:hypothetical protein
MKTSLSQNKTNTITSPMNKDTQRPLSKIPIRANSSSQSRSRSPALTTKNRLNYFFFKYSFIAFFNIIIDMFHHQKLHQKYLYQYRQLAKVLFISLMRMIGHPYRNNKIQQKIPYELKIKLLINKPLHLLRLLIEKHFHHQRKRFHQLVIHQQQNMHVNH